MNISNTVVEPIDLYKPSSQNHGALYDQSAPSRTLECLNGALTDENLSGGFKIEPWMTQIGTFARGAYWGSDRWEFIHARQMDHDVTTESVSDDVLSNDRIVLAGLSRTLFIPWKPSFIMYGFQGYFRQEARVWGLADTGSDDHNGSDVKYESWDLQVKINGTTNDAMRSILPPGGGTREAPIAANLEMGDSKCPGNVFEEQWRWIEKSSMTTSVTTAGFFDFEVSIGPNIEAPDAMKAKVVITNCAAWVLALR